MIRINNISLLKFQAFLRLYLLQLLIPADGHFESRLSLAIDRALADLEATWI